LTTPAYQRERRRLAEALKELRVGAGLSGARLSEMLGWQQSKVSKIETRKQLPSEEDITAWVGAAGGFPEKAGELLGMLRGARVEYAAWKDAYRDSGADGVQADILELEAQTTRISEFQPAMISGLLQTSEYAREFLHLPCGPQSFGADEEAIDQMVAKRMQRQQVLYEHGKQVQVVMLEGALRCRVVSAPTLAGQLDRLLAISGLSSLELGIIPFEAAVPVFPLSGFRLYDDLVIVESIVGEQQLAEPDEQARPRDPRKLRFLADTDSANRNAMPSAMLRHLAAWQPALSGMYGEPSQKSA
jgi:transcriptional regulator with XRE-family HTH domain